MRQRGSTSVRGLVATGLLWLAASGVAGAQGLPAAPGAALTRPHVERLASPAFDGRMAGSPGEREAANYIAGVLAAMGAQPLPGQDSVFQPFGFTAGTRDGGSSVVVTRNGQSQRFAAGTSVQALSFSDDAEVAGEVVFAGYGLVVPPSQEVEYDSYVGLDVTDKIVVVLHYVPEDAEPRTRAALARYAGLRYKAMAARQRGARALLVVTGPRSPGAGGIVPMSFDTALAGSGIPAASVGGDVADALFAGAERTLADVQRDLDSGNPHVPALALPAGEVRLTTSVVRVRQEARNVVAYLPATETTPGAASPWIVVGAHYDHLGRGAHGNSLASREDAGGIHHGADDNASGTAAVLALGARLARAPRPRHVVLALWSAEEIGLLGSAAFVAAPPLPLSEVAAYVNFDMVGRMRDNKLVAQATGTSPVWPRLLERANVLAGFDLTVQADPYQPTDVATFNQAGVPSLSFTTGSHVDYHKPSDTADKINYEDLDRVVDLAETIVRGVGAAPEAPQFTRVEQPQSRASMAGVRVTTGTIPDYATEVRGLLLGGVVAGGPAERAGLAKGDVIVEIAGQTIANIYDYTYALELLRADQAVTVAFVRDGQRREVQLVPAARR